MRWKLENGREVTAEDLAEEITRVPRTHFWRLSHVALLWPIDADPDSTASVDGFGDGFAIELLAVEGAVEWLLQPVGADASRRLTGRAAVGRDAVLDAFTALEALAAARESERRSPC